MCIQVWLALSIRCSFCLPANSEIKWFYPLEGDLRKVQTLWDVIMVSFKHPALFACALTLGDLLQCWRMTRFGKFVTQNTVWGHEKFGMVPKGTHDVGEALKTAGTCQSLFLDLLRSGQLLLRERY